MQNMSQTFWPQSGAASMRLIVHGPFHLFFTDAKYVANILFGTDPRRGRVGEAVCCSSPHVAEGVSKTPKTYFPKLASILIPECGLAISPRDPPFLVPV